MDSRQVRRAAAAVTTAAGLVVAAAAVPSTAGAAEGKGAGARNVILLIGDGMGDFEMTAARYYQYGAQGRLAMDAFPERSTVSTSSVLPDGGPDYVPESASTATAFSTGVKTVDGRIGTDRQDRDAVSMIDLAERAGMLTGNVATSEITDATPAAQMAHVASRGCQGPANMGDCPQDAKPAGAGSIAEQSIDHRVDVLLGGGWARYDQPTSAGPTVAQQAASAGYSVVRTRQELQGATLPVLGLFAAGNLPTELAGPQAKPGGVAATCTPNPAFGQTPTLEELTARAVSLLERPRGGGRAKGQPGFFLQVEGASIDKQDHAANPCAQVGETLAFDRAVKVALDYARTAGNTTVIVSADHSHTSQIIPSEDIDSPGARATLTTREGQPLQLNYGTSPTTGSQDHTGSTVPYLAFGPGTAGVPALLDQTDLFGIVTRSLGLR